jgi:hypothetical protein
LIGRFGIADIQLDVALKRLAAFFAGSKFLRHSEGAEKSHRQRAAGG